MVAHAVGQGPDGVVQDQQVLVLVLVEGEHQSLQNEAKIGHQLSASLEQISSINFIHVYTLNTCVHMHLLEAF